MKKCCVSRRLTEYLLYGPLPAGVPAPPGPCAEGQRAVLIGGPPVRGQRLHRGPGRWSRWPITTSRYQPLHRPVPRWSG